MAFFCRPATFAKSSKLRRAAVAKEKELAVCRSLCLSLSLIFHLWSSLPCVHFISGVLILWIDFSIFGLHFRVVCISSTDSHLVD